jgi:hypothetical protein
MFEKYVKKRKAGISTANEPYNDLCITANFKNYPDMYKVYEKMKLILDINDNCIMLGNGFENVMKNILIALKPTTLTWFKPAWSMLDTYCE